MPLASASEFDTCLKKFITKSEVGIAYRNSLTIFYDEENSRLKYMKITA